MRTNSSPVSARLRLCQGIAALLAAACLALIAYKWTHSAQPPAPLPVPVCDLARQDCATVLPDGGQLGLSLGPRPPRALETLTLTVRLTGIDARRVEVDFDGVDMRMGYNRVRLSGNDGLFSGNAVLPVCVTGTMRWQATVLIDRPQGPIAIPFHFDAAAPAPGGQRP